MNSPGSGWSQLVSQLTLCAWESWESDPANIVGSDDDILKGYAKIRDQILVKIKLLKEEI